MTKLKISILVLSIILQSCASIIKGSTQTVFVTSSPAEANVKVKDVHGNNVVSTVSPATLTLKRGSGYFSSASYSVEVSKAGYQTQYITLTGGLNGWYIAGNILIGGLIGWLIVDPISGGMWTLSPESVNLTLASEGTKTTKYDTNSELHIALIEEVPDALRSNMTRIK